MRNEWGSKSSGTGFETIANSREGFLLTTWWGDVLLLTSVAASVCTVAPQHTHLKALVGFFRYWLHSMYSRHSSSFPSSCSSIFVTACVSLISCMWQALLKAYWDFRTLHGEVTEVLRSPFQRTCSEEGPWQTASRCCASTVLQCSHEAMLCPGHTLPSLRVKYCILCLLVQKRKQSTW